MAERMGYDHGVCCAPELLVTAKSGSLDATCGLTGAAISWRGGVSLTVIWLWLGNMSLGQTFIVFQNIWPALILSLICTVFEIPLSIPTKFSDCQKSYCCHWRCFLGPRAWIQSIYCSTLPALWLCWKSSSKFLGSWQVLNNSASFLGLSYLIYFSRTQHSFSNAHFLFAICNKDITHRLRNLYMCLQTTCWYLHIWKIFEI